MTSTTDIPTLVGDFMGAHIVETTKDFEETEGALEVLLERVRDEAFKAGFADGFENGKTASEPNGKESEVPK